MSGLLPLWAPGTRKGPQETTGLLSEGGGQVVLTDYVTDRSPVFPFHPGLSWTLLVVFLHFTRLWSFSVLYFVWLYLDWNTPIQSKSGAEVSSGHEMCVSTVRVCACCFCF